MQKKAWVIVIICFLCLSSALCFADSKGMKDMLQSETIGGFTEKNEISKAWIDSFDTVEKNYKSPRDGNIVNIDNEKTLSTEWASKVYSMTSDFEERFNQNSFGSLISKEYIWQIPVFGSNGKVVSLCNFKKGENLSDIKRKYGDISVKDKVVVEKSIIANEGNWVLDVQETGSINSGVDFYSNKNNVIKFLLENGVSSPSEIKAIQLPGYLTYVVYVKESTQEYGIPFATREDMKFFENGILYKMNDFMKKLLDSPSYKFKKQASNSTSGKIGELEGSMPVSSNVAKKNFFEWTSVITVGAFSLLGLVIISGVVVLWKRIHKKLI